MVKKKPLNSIVNAYTMESLSVYIKFHYVHYVLLFFSSSNFDGFKYLFSKETMQQLSNNRLAEGIAAACLYNFSYLL